MVPDVRLKKSPGHLRILFVICLFLAVFSDKHWTDIFGRGVNPAGDSGDTSPQNVERGTVIRHVPPKYGAYML